MFSFKSLDSKLIGHYVPLISLVLLGLFAVFELRQYRVHERGLNDGLRLLISIHQGALARAVSEHDIGGIGRLLKSMETNPNFQGAIVYDSFDQIIGKAGNIDRQTADPIRVVEADLVADDQNHTDPAGKLVLIFHSKELDRQLTERVQADALIIAVLIAAFILFTPLISRRLGATPIGRLRSAMEKPGSGKIREPLQWDSHGELGQIVHAFNDVEAGQATAESELREHKRRLEELVSQRSQELQMGQRLLTAILDNSSALICVKQANGIYQIVNRAWCNLLHLDNREVIGKTDYELFPAELAAKFRESDLRVLGTGQPVSEEEPIRADGTEHTLISLKLPLLDSQRSCYATCGIYSDITERKKLEHGLMAARESAAAASRSKSEFGANLGREILNPTNGIIGFAELALKTDLSEEQRTILLNIQNSADRLLTQINDVLDLSRIEAGKLDIKATSFDLNNLLAELADQCAESADRKNIELIIYKSPDVPDSLLGDPLRLLQILVHLTDNAINFIEQGEVVVNANRAEYDPGNRTIRFSVRHTGTGIAAEQTAKLFSSFSQIGGSSACGSGGDDLGLAICAQLVTLMKGRIGVHSVPGEGSTFWCEIPFEPGNKPVERSDQTEHRFRVEKFLIVEDNPASLAVLQEMLHGFGFQTLTASSGEQALDQLRQDGAALRVDAVLMDWKLPRMDGLEAAAKIRSMNTTADLPIVVMISASGRDRERQAIEKIGVNGLLTKPIRQSALLATLVDLFSERRQIKPTHWELPETFRYTGQLAGISLLLAENNPINEDAALDLLNDLGARVDVVRNGVEAVEATQHKPYDAVLMDIRMPGMDGFQATAMIRQRFGPEQLPIIGMTMPAMDGDQDNCIGAGMNDSISKPIDPGKLAGTLFQWLKPSRSIPGQHDSAPSTGHADKDFSAHTAKEIANRIRDAAFMGNLSELQSIAESLPADSYWASEVSRLTDHIDFDGLEKLAHALNNLS